MSAVDVAEKRCARCGQVKNLSEFHRHASRSDGRGSYCAPCGRERALEAKARRRARLGDDEFKRRELEAVRRHRENTGNARGRIQGQAYNAAVTRLIASRRKEFDAYYREERHARGLAI